MLAPWGVRTVDDLTEIEVGASSAIGPSLPRRTLLLGGARSGKSHEAERMLAATAEVEYVATGGTRAGDDEWAARVALHRSRRPASWTTTETLDVAKLLLSPGPPVLLDCLSLWLAGALDAAGVPGRPSPATAASARRRWPRSSARSRPWSTRSGVRRARSCSCRTRSAAASCPSTSPGASTATRSGASTPGSPRSATLCPSSSQGPSCPSSPEAAQQHRDRRPRRPRRPHRPARRRRARRRGRAAGAADQAGRVRSGGSRSSRCGCARRRACARRGRSSACA